MKTNNKKIYFSTKWWNHNFYLDVLHIDNDECDEHFDAIYVYKDGEIFDTHILCGTYRDYIREIKQTIINVTGLNFINLSLVPELIKLFDESNSPLIKRCKKINLF